MATNDFEEYVQRYALVKEVQRYYDDVNKLINKR